MNITQMTSFVYRQRGDLKFAFKQYIDGNTTI